MELSNEVRDYLLEVAEIFGKTISDIFDIHVEQITDGRHSKQDDLACESMSLTELDKLHELNMESYAKLRRQLLAQAIKEYGFLNKNGRLGEYWLPFFSAIIPRVEELDDNENIPALRRRQERMIDKKRRKTPRPTAASINCEAPNPYNLREYWETLYERGSPFS